MKKRLLSIFLALCLVLGLLPWEAQAAGGLSLAGLQAKFPDGKYWNGGNVDSYTSSPCPSHANSNTSYCNCFTTDGGKAWQCYGFALKLGYDAYGTSPRKWNYTTKSNYVDSLKPGDIIDNSGNPYHTVFVIGVTDTSVTVGECNYGGRCLIKWGRSISKSAIKKYKSLKIYIAPNALDTGTPAPAPAPKLDLAVQIWVSESRESLEKAANSRISQGKVEKFYYLWFKLYDKNTGKLLNELRPSTNYNTNMTVIAPDGTQHTVDYTKSDNNWKGFPASVAGNYACKVTFTGGITGNTSYTFPVVADKPVITPDKTSVAVETGKNAVCNLIVIPNGGKYVDALAENGNICAISWGEVSQSQGQAIIPMYITGKTAGKTTVTAYILDANKNKLVASNPVSVTVTGPSNPPTVTMDKSEVSMTAGEKASINLSFQPNGVATKASFQVEDSGICSASWGQQGSDLNKKSLTILGLSAGNTGINVNMLDSSSNIVATKRIAVTVSPKQQETTPPQLDTSTGFMTIDEGASQSFEIFWTGTIPAGSRLSIQSVPDSNNSGSVSLKWGSKGSDSRTVNVTGNRAGICVLNIAIKDSGGNVLTSTSVSVTVNGKKQEASVSLSPSSVTLQRGEVQSIGVSYQGDYYTRRVEFSTPGIFILSYDGEYPGAYETVAVTGVRAGTSACRVVLEDEYGSELAQAVLNVTVEDNTGLDDVITTPSRGDDWQTTGNLTAFSRSYGQSNATLEDEIGGSGSVTGMGVGQFPAPSGFSSSGSTEIKTGSTAANTNSSTGKNEPAAIKDLTAGTGTGADVNTGTDSMTFSVTISDPTVSEPSAPSMPSASSQDFRFTDVMSDKYYYESVVWAEKTGVTAGIAGNTLGPNGNCPRGQVVEFIWRALGATEPDSSNNPFTDVSASNSYYKAVLWAYEKGITTGTSDTEFSPNATCTRAQVMTFLWRAKDQPAGSGTNPFTDVENSAYYVKAVCWAVEKGITTGTSATTFSPKDLCTRAQILTFLYRCISG